MLLIFAAMFVALLVLYVQLLVTKRWPASELWARGIAVVALLAICIFLVEHSWPDENPKSELEELEDRLEKAKADIKKKFGIDIPRKRELELGAFDLVLQDANTPNQDVNRLLIDELFNKGVMGEIEDDSIKFSRLPEGICKNLAARINSLGGKAIVSPVKGDR